VPGTRARGDRRLPGRTSRVAESPGATVAATQPAGKAATPTNPSPTVTHVAVTLGPSGRSVGSTLTVEIPSGPSAVTLTLRLDPDALDSYDIALRDLATDTVAWHAEAAPASGTDPNRMRVLTIPATTLRSGSYASMCPPEPRTNAIPSPLHGRAAVALRCYPQRTPGSDPDFCPRARRAPSRKNQDLTPVSSFGEFTADAC
jgi:hypothetical protein